MKITKKIYEDYFKPSRLGVYEKFLAIAKENDYEMVGILDFYRLSSSGDLQGRKILINRHDIDTSPKTARKMFEIEKRVYGENGTATYYFRKSTTDRSLINDIEKYGYETGYHYEEIASFEKKMKYKNVDMIKNHMGEIETDFLKNLDAFRNETGSKSLSVASHGDFINVKYKMQNFEILKNASLREKAGIEVEAYDEKVMKYVNKRFADQVLIGRYFEEVSKGIFDNTPVIMCLTHPRNWETDFISNTRENVERFIADVKYRL